jgi:hypothetical protein
MVNIASWLARRDSTRENSAASGTLADMSEKHNREDRSMYRLSDDEREALEQSAEDVREDRFATGEQVAAIFRKYRQSPDQRTK